ncbi:hypothetical protein [Minwuia thermotolerans]|jgi:cell wall-associated NlpC family hydrolase|uniref:NlpC/P60 domain-containing protein n=1 Tax=Minwuia thermotolerans TaxID=2056226 RepID=A0A2M9G429_9PROT|nr:hypothetical protein [Minwuia thermotolerans]ANK79381.1 MAG: hypothetical protein TEF_00205 [Rhizobiales bacterium NRL2]PJK29340.1 hypothetical protein CVT23_12110 [Minwuia thermotolerans]PJK30475.1 hypothetical protein CVT23_05885 [Minwuia thermotolerans]PJK30698.1 hypothetical protein CVT23_04835 [Minwuia thermotolerans]
MLNRSDSIRFVRPLIGLPWERGAAGPDAFDCGSFTAFVQRGMMGRELPVSLADYGDLVSAAALRQAIADAELDAAWPVVTRAEGEEAARLATTAGWRHGDVVVFRRGAFCHVGTWTALGQGATGLLHCARFDGVVLEPWSTARARSWTSIEACRPAAEAKP